RSSRNALHPLVKMSSALLSSHPSIMSPCPVQAKYVRGFAVSVLQEPAKRFPTVHRYSMFWDTGRHKHDMAHTLIWTLLMMGHVCHERVPGKCSAHRMRCDSVASPGCIAIWGVRPGRTPKAQ